MSSGVTKNAIKPYPYWSEPTKHGNSGHMTLYWSELVEISSMVSGQPGKYTINCSSPAGTHWETVEVAAPTMDEAKRIAEVILKFIELERGK